MLRLRPKRPVRTTLNLSDAKQVKSVRKRLGISDTDLARIIDKSGNSLVAIEKQVELERLAALEQSRSKEERATSV